MRTSATILACLAALPLAANPAAAQSDQARNQPPGQTVMKRPMGNKSQTSPFGSKAADAKTKFGETQEQHDHYLHRNPDDQPITSSTANQSHDDD